MSIHDGHRERLKDRFAEYGLESFNELNTLELLLFYSIPRRDTNEIAHALLDRFGSLAEVFDASVRELESVTGVGRNTALLIRLIPEVSKRCAISRTKDITVFDRPGVSGRYLCARLGTEKAEKALLLCLDPRKQLISCVEIGSGVVDNVSINVRQVVETALKYRASSVVLAHNHPTGNPAPSRDDELMTRRIRDALQLVEIRLDDHIIVGGSGWFSFTESGLLLYPMSSGY